MANLLNHEDLKKLQGFIEFVSANPTILNMPQLGFVKKFIEKFGGMVPTGDFKMPGGGKCPFGGDSSDDDEGVKAEPKAAETEAADEVEMDSDSESEIELDMEAGAFLEYNTLEPEDDSIGNVIFLKEKPIKFIRKSGKRRKKELKKSFKKRRIPSDEAFHIHECEVATNVEENKDEDDDPIKLSAVEVIIKTELADSEEDTFQERLENSDDSDFEQNYSELDENDDEADECNEDAHTKSRRTNLKKPRTKPKRKLREPKFKKTKIIRPIICVESCTLKCRENITINQRRQIRLEFYELSHVEQQNYILKWVEIRSGRKIRVDRKRMKRGFRSRYFLPGHNGERHRVCIKFFISTLAINNNYVKTTLENSHAQAKLSEQQINDYTFTANNDSMCKDTGLAAPHDNTDDSTKISENEMTPDLPIQTKTGRKPKDKINKAPKKQRLPQPSRCEQISCLMKCSTHFTEEQRVQICATFWALDYKRRKDFLISKTESKPLQTMLAPEYRKTTKAQRAYQNLYYLRGASGNNVRVCLRFFLATLCISRKVIHEAISNVDQQTGLYIGEDKRRIGKNKISEDMVEEVKCHIESFPTWVPHKSSKTRYLDSSLSILYMYRQYKEKCELQQRKTVSNAFYYYIFHKHYQLEFLKRTNKHPTRIQPCRRKPRMPDDQRPTKPKKVNVNISEYKGDEPGGYWIPAAIGDSVPTINTKPVVQIQENVQVQTAYYADSRPDMPQRVEEQIPQQQSKALVALPTYEYSDYTQYPEFYRML